MIAIDTDALLFAIALTYAIMTFAVVFIIYASERAFKTKAEPYVSSILPRIGSMIVDITVLRLIIELLFVIGIPSYESIPLLLFTYLPLNPIYIPFVIVGTFVSNFLFFYIPLFGGSVLSLSTVLYTIIIFLYFFVFEAFLGGRTLGRYIFRLKTVHTSRCRILQAKEASINALGKTFLMLDLSLGFLAAICYSHNPGLRQVRLSQRISGAVTMKTSFDTQSVGDICDPFSDYYSEEGEST